MTNEQNLKFHITEIVAEGFRLLNKVKIVQGTVFKSNYFLQFCFSQKRTYADHSTDVYLV